MVKSEEWKYEEWDWVNDDGTYCTVSDSIPSIKRVADFELCFNLEKTKVKFKEKNLPNLGHIGLLAALEIDHFLLKRQVKLPNFEILKEIFRTNMILSEYSDKIWVDFNDHYSGCYNYGIICNSLEKMLNTKFRDEKVDDHVYDFSVEYRQMFELMQNFEKLSLEGKKYVEKFCLELSKQHTIFKARRDEQFGRYYVPPF